MNEDPESFWPLKFLRHEPHLDSVRILTFGYNARYEVGSGRANVSLIDISKQLLSGLKYASDDCSSVSDDSRMGDVGVDTFSLSSYRSSRLPTDPL